MSQSWKYPNILPPNKEKRAYPCGPSLLDQQNSHSKINQTKFKGFFSMTIIFVMIFVFSSSILDKIQNNYYFEPSLYNTFKEDYFLCVMIWPLFFIWSFTSYLLQKLILMGMPRIFSLLYQYATEATLFIFSSIMIFSKNWCSSHCAFVIMQACVHFMKMHSYSTVNRDYRQQRIQAENKNEKILSNYPHNINIKDFILFMWTPWLVYDQYPRKSQISYAYIARKSIISIFCILTAYIIYTEYILAFIKLGTKIQSLELLFLTMLPNTIFIILLFYLTFQCITNIFAEITKLDYRQFYEDWWNSTTYQQFNRKWNKPVHIFLYRHIYLQIILRYKMSKMAAQFLTFLFSAILHQYLLAMIFRTIRPYLFFFIIGQVPLIFLTKFMSGKNSGNYLFWEGIVTGPAIIITLYLRTNDQITDMFALPVYFEKNI